MVERVRITHVRQLEALTLKDGVQDNVSGTCGKYMEKTVEKGAM